MFIGTQVLTYFRNSLLCGKKTISTLKKSQRSALKEMVMLESPPQVFKLHTSQTIYKITC